VHMRVLVFCGRLKAPVEKQRPKVRGVY
jgi:hypothetical protein